MIIIVPISAHAQLHVPTNSYGLATKTNISNLIVSIINWFLSFLSALAVLMIVVSGIMYLTSGGDQQRIDTAKKWLVYSIVGLVIALLSFVIVYSVSTIFGLN
jgi:type IV secretory pathway VirB2 component (pilin)